ncbi:MAG: M12 family metallopeptidase, partial [Kofleriaceae bacterium]
MKSQLVNLMVVLAATSCAIDEAEVDETSTEQGLHVRSWVIWRNPNIPVCFDNGGTADERRWVQEAVRDTWEAASSVRFVNWNNCQWFNMGIRVRMSDSRGYASGLGMELNGVALGVNLDTHVRTDSCFLASREDCVRATAIHEFGHALGFAHEQSRADTPDDCLDGQDFESSGDQTVGAWDLNSVMNYCNPAWNNNGFLSTTDVIGVRQYYGKFGRWTDARVFDPAFYRAANPGAGISTNAETATVHWLAQGLPMSGLRGSRTFDVGFYLAQHADLRAAFGSKFHRTLAHYQDAGIFEGRRASREFDVRFYERIYPDVSRDHAAALDHFIYQGLPNEGRRGAREFDVLFYEIANADIAAAFGMNYTAAFDHWVTQGLPNENRRGSTEVDVQYYMTKYLDVGTNRIGAIDHFIRTGLGLGRRASIEFDVAYYLANNADVLAAYGLDYAAAFDHWVAAGRAEGRLGAMPVLQLPPRPPIFCRPGRC